MQSVSTPPHRRRAAAGLAVLALAAVACSSSTKSSLSSQASSAAGAASSAGGSAASAASSAGSAASSAVSGGTGGATVASKLTLGAPPECPKNAFCVPGLQKTYGITFKAFKPLDADGPLTYQAITSGQVDVAEVFSSDAQIAADNLVLLKDDKQLESADYVVPVLRTAKATPFAVGLLNQVSAALTTDELIGLNKQVVVDKADPQPTADAWLKSHNLDTATTDLKGQSFTVAGFNFSESSILAYLYGDALKAAGASVTVKANLGNRQTLEPGLQSGQIDLIPEYAASALEYLDHSAGLASGDVTATVGHLTDQFTPLKITVAKPSGALDTNAFVVTKATAAKYNLSKLSDLAAAG